MPTFGRFWNIFILLKCLSLDVCNLKFSISGTIEVEKLELPQHVTRPLNFSKNEQKLLNLMQGVQFYQL